jgi:GDPmannose 4,6-dehydratase
MLQSEQPADYVIATGETHSVRELCDVAFSRLGLEYNEFVIVDPALYRPAEVTHLRGDASAAHLELDWFPKVGFRELVEMMVDAERVEVPA